MSIAKALESLVRRHEGKISLIKTIKIDENLIAEPICEDIDNDGKNELILASEQGTIYIISSEYKLKARFRITENIDETESMFIDASTGYSITHSPLVADIDNDGKKEIIFGTEFGTVYCIDPNGKLKWTFKSKGAIRGGVSFFDADSDSTKEIIFGSTDKNLYILNSNGKKKKVIKLNSEIESTPALINGSIIVCLNNGEIIGISTKGELQWNLKTEGKVTSKPKLMLTEEKTYAIVTSTDNKVYCINQDGKLEWSYETEGSIYGNAIIKDIDQDGYPEIILGSCDNKLHIISDQGSKKWDFTTDFWVVGSPILMDINTDNKQEIVLGSYDTNIYVLSGRGEYVFDYVPGISGIITQEGGYSEIPSDDPGQIQGKKLWTYKTKGLITGICSNNKQLIVQTKDGRVLWLANQIDQ